MAKIDCLIVENYRGASTRLQLDFDADKPVVLIFGENGTGKTTIVDALDAIGNCSKGSLEDKSSTRARDHLPTIGKKPVDIRIQITAGATSWAATLTGDNLATTPPMRPKIRVLRRGRLQRLIEAQPAQRYEELRHFIDVDKVERSENALRDSASDVKGEFDTAVGRRADAEAQLQKVWEAEGKSGTDALDWAKSTAETDTKKLDEIVQGLRNAQTVFVQAESALAEFQLASNNYAQREFEAQAVELEVAKLSGVDAQQAIRLAGILKQVDDHLKAGKHADECPVCRQGIPLDKLKADIQARLEELKAYDALRTKRDVAARNVQTARQAVDPRQNALIAAGQSLLDIVQKGDIEVIAASGIKHVNYPELAKKNGADIHLAVAEAGKLIGAFSPVKQALADAENAMTRKSGLINSIRIQYGNVRDSSKLTEELEKLHVALHKAYDTVRLTRIEFTQKILDDIAAECNRLYAIIHPHEPIAISKLALDQGKRASLNQAATFEGHNNVPPQAYFSESHLDTLGFCFWLALARRESINADTIIVLDDVFTSVDAQHLNRIAKLITDEGQHFAQTIVTTHQRLWRDIYRYQYGAGKVTQLIELQRWSLSKGISNYRTKLAVDELVAFIAATPFDRQVTASKAGILLEAILDYLALQYRCRVPRTHDGSYTLGELLDSTESLFKKLEIHRPDIDGSGKPKVPAQYVSANCVAVMSQIRSLNFLRNQVGAHFNVAGAAVSDADVQQFSDLTVKLAEALSCPTCGQIPGKKMAAYSQCSCTAPFEVRMLPLQL